MAVFKFRYGGHKTLVIVLTFVLCWNEILSDSLEDENDMEENGDFPTNRSMLLRLQSSSEILNSSKEKESIRPEHDFSSVSLEDHGGELDFLHQTSSSERPLTDPETTSAGDLNQWQFRKMPDDEINYHEDVERTSTSASTKEEFGEMSAPSVIHPYPMEPHPAEDRTFLMRHSTRIKLPTYIPVYSKGVRIPHRRGKGRRHGRRRHHGPHHHHHGPHHHHGQQPYAPKYISYGPIYGHPPNLGSHSVASPVFVPVGGHGHEHGHGHSHGHPVHHGPQHHHGSHSHHSHAIHYSGNGPPLPPFFGHGGGGPPHLGRPMAAVYIPGPPAPPVNHYESSGPHKEYDEEMEYTFKEPPNFQKYFPPTTSYKSAARKRPTEVYSSLSKSYGSDSSPGYEDEVPTSSFTNYGSRPSSRYRTAGKSRGYGSPPMNFGQPMHNYGPPMSSYGKPPPIIGDVPSSIYEPTDEMYKYKNDPPNHSFASGSEYTYGGAGGSNFPRNQYGGGMKYKSNNKGWYTGWKGHKGPSRSNEEFQTTGPSSYSNEVEYTPKPSPTYRTPTKLYSPPIPGYRGKKNLFGNDNYPQTGKDHYSRFSNNLYKYKPEGSQVIPDQSAIPPSGPPMTHRPPPDYDTRYNSPGLSMDPKIVDFMPYSTKDYRDIKTRTRGLRGSRKQKYTTLPDSLHSHKPDPEHENYPKLTYEAIKKRVMALRDLQTSASLKKTQRKKTEPEMLEQHQQQQQQQLQQQRQYQRRQQIELIQKQREEQRQIQHQDQQSEPKNE